MPSNEPRKLDFLDALRGLAILLVLLVHGGDLAALFGPTARFSFFGQRGVQLFYIVSAFSLLYSMHVRRGQSAAGFFVRRFFRIAPLFYLSVAANVLYTLFVAKQPLLPAGYYLAGVFFLFGFSPLTINAVAPAAWSIAVESTFYLFFPALAKTVRNLALALVLSSVTAAVCFWVCYEGTFIPASWPAEYVRFLWFPVQFPVFCFGFAAFFLWRELRPVGSPETRVTPQGARMRSLVLLLLSAVVLWLSFPVNNLHLYPNAVGLALFVVALGIHPWSLFVNPATIRIGQLSYSIYLIHPYCGRPIAWMIEYLNGQWGWPLYGTVWGLLAGFLGYLTCAFLLALFTYKFIELPGIAFGRRMAAKLEGKPMAQSQDSALSASEQIATPVISFRRSGMMYTLWALSLVATMAFTYTYRRHDPEAAIKSAGQYREQIEAQQKQIETLSAELMQNQRALKATEKELGQVMTDYRKTLEAMKNGR